VEQGTAGDTVRDRRKLFPHPGVSHGR
jgi:hypothetical protein